MEFKGCDNPKVYVIDCKAHEEDIASGYPLSGERGGFVCSLLGSMDLLPDTRFACWEGQTPAVVIEDIVKCNPQVVIGFGSELLKLLTGSIRPITEVSGNVYDAEFGGQSFKYIPVMSPSYVLKRLDDNTVSLKFSQDLYKAYQIVNGEYKDVLKEKEVLNAHSFKEFVDIYESRLIDNPKISYDIETNARPSMFAGSKIIGFSIANKTSGVYVSIDSLDFHMPKEEEDKIWSYLINEVFEKKEKLIIHNTMYERPYTLYCKNYEIGFDKADDTLVMARLLKGAKESAGLKYQAQKNLHYPDWETDLGRYIEGFRAAVDRLGLGPDKYKELWSKICSSGKGIFYVNELPEYESFNEKDKEEINEIVNKIKNPCIELYSEEELKNISNLITEKINKVIKEGGVKDSTIPYSYLPDRVLSKYGAVDSLATFDLYDFFMDFMDKESTDKVDLHKGYEIWLEHMYVAYIMERNGLYWNEDLVVKDKAFLTEQATNCLRKMLLSSVFKPLVLSQMESLYKPKILSDYLPIIAESQGYKVIYDHDTEKYTVYFNGKRCAKGNISKINILDSYRKDYDDLVMSLFYEDVNKCTHYEELKSFYNPSSITHNHIPRTIFETSNLQMGGRINKLHTLSTSPDFEPLKDNLPALDQKFLKISDMLCDSDKLKEIYGKEWAEKRKELYAGFCTLYNSRSSEIVTPEIKEIIKEKVPVVIESFDDEGIISIYNSYVVTGIDPDDRSTWSPIFEWLINFRLYKKSQKLISVYIDGSTGHQSVTIIDSKQSSEGDNRLERKCWYSDRSEPRLKDGETYLLNAKWSPNTAETGRWRSGFHTIPWNSQVKKYYTSRFKGGTIVAPDYAQMEVRTLGAVAHDTNMLDLFKRGDDFHTETAKTIYRKDEVTPAERRFSKTATFSLLYGSSVNSYVNTYCKGDIDYAKMIYDGFFRAYPNVQKWVEERHKEVQESHRVSLELSNRFISIFPEGQDRGAINAMLRRAQNYPIQAQSADLTGCVIYDLQKYIEEHNMKSKIIMYVHDSIEIDIYPYEMIQFVEALKFILNDSPMRRMGLPSHADVTLGCSLGHEIEMESIEHNEDYTECTMELKGFKNEIEETVKNWKDAYALVEISDENWKESFTSMGELFILKKAFTPTLGATRYKGTCKVHIKYYN